MNETAVVLILTLLMSVVCWLLVFSRRARDNVQKPAWKMYKLKEEQRDLWDGIYLAGVLVLALVFTIVFGVTLILAIRKSF